MSKEPKNLSEEQFFRVAPQKVCQAIIENEWLHFRRDAPGCPIEEIVIRIRDGKAEVVPGSSMGERVWNSVDTSWSKFNGQNR